MTLYLTDAVL